MFDVQAARAAGAFHLSDAFRHGPWYDTGSGNADGAEDTNRLVNGVRNEIPGVDGASALGGRYQTHFRHGLFRDIAEIHEAAGGETDGFHSRLQLFVSLEFRRRLSACFAEVGCAHDHYRHSVVD